MITRKIAGYSFDMFSGASHPFPDTTSLLPMQQQALHPREAPLIATRTMLIAMDASAVQIKPSPFAPPPANALATGVAGSMLGNSAISAEPFGSAAGWQLNADSWWLPAMQPISALIGRPLHDRALMILLAPGLLPSLPTSIARVDAAMFGAADRGVATAAVAYIATSTVHAASAMLRIYAHCGARITRVASAVAMLPPGSLLSPSYSTEAACMRIVILALFDELDPGVRLAARVCGLPALMQ